MARFLTCLISHSCHFDLYMNEKVDERNRDPPMQMSPKNKITYFSNLPGFQETLDPEVLYDLQEVEYFSKSENHFKEYLKE